MNTRLLLSGCECSRYVSSLADPSKTIFRMNQQWMKLPPKELFHSFMKEMFPRAVLTLRDIKKSLRSLPSSICFSPFIERNEILMKNEPAINSIHLNFGLSLRSLAFHSYEHKYWQGGFIHLRSFVLKSFLMRKNSFLCFRSGWLAFVVRGKLMLCQLGVERWWMELTVVSPVLPQKLRFPLNDHQVLCAVVVRHERQREMERM